MLPHNLTKERQHVKRILERWSRMERLMLQFSKNVYLMFLIWIAISHRKGDLGYVIFLTALVGVSAFCLYNQISRFAIRQFASRLTEEEKILLRNAIIDTTIEDNQTIKDLLIASQKKGISSTELLRASQSAQLADANTLLRHAIKTEYTPDDQLLRAAPKEEIQTIEA